MDKICECATNYNNILNTQYRFSFSFKRKVTTITLDFKEEDFRHASGLHYLDDITIERDPKKVLAAITAGDITDEKLAESDKYKIVNPSIGTIEERIEEMAYIESYLDTSDFIRIYKTQEFGSQINADYFIEAVNQKRKTTVYMFIRKRDESDNYVLVSFFKKKSVFKGISTYWMLKEKITNGAVTELYRHPNYNT